MKKQNLNKKQVKSVGHANSKLHALLNQYLEKKKQMHNDFSPFANQKLQLVQSIRKCLNGAEIRTIKIQQNILKLGANEIRNMANTLAFQNSINQKVFNLNLNERKNNALLKKNKQQQMFSSQANYKNLYPQNKMLSTRCKSAVQIKKYNSTSQVFQGPKQNIHLKSYSSLNLRPNIRILSKKVLKQQIKFKNRNSSMQNYRQKSSKLYIHNIL